MHVVIPAYQPTARLPQLVDELLSARPSLEVLVVDDGSDLACRPHLDACRAAGAQVLTLDRNHGKGHALRAAFLHLTETRARGPVVTADADGQHAAADVLAVAEAVDDTVGAPPHLVLGQRHLDSTAPLRSRVGNAVTRLMFRVATGRRVVDTQTGLRAFPATLLPWLITLRGERYEYELVMLLQASRHHVDLREVGISTIYLDDNASSHFRPVADSVRIYAPLLTFVTTSLLAFLIDTGVLLALHAIGSSLLPAVVLARLVSGTANFTLNRRLVFPGADAARRRHSAAGRYAALALCLLAANYLLLSVLCSTGLPLLPAKVLTELVLVGASYAVQARFVFARSRSHFPVEDAAASRP